VNPSIILRPFASAEYLEAIAWFERQQRGRGRRFSRAVNEAFDEIVADPMRWPLADDAEDVRIDVVEGWPFVVIYRVVPTAIHVISVFHNSRDPQEWMGRT
jgi:plasmid stabilization system protein ParE